MSRITDFDYDCYQKKKLANSARNKKRGSKSKSCRLQSDNLTKKQWNERNGIVMSFNLSKPMEWKTFKRMSKGMQEEYIAKLQNEYGVTCQKITDMLGISPLTIRRYIHAHNLKVVFTPGARMSSHQSRDWDNFVSGRSTISTVDDHAGTPELNVERSPEPTVIVKSPTSVVSNKQMHMTNMSLKFGGTLDVNEIAASLRVILGESSNGCLEIICNIDN